MVTTIKFAKLRDEAKIPTKEKENAGYDIYACFDEDYVIIPAHTTKLIPTGICSAFDEDYMILLEERGSTGSKGLKRSAGVIDSGYRGEWFVAITNTTDLPYVINKTNRKTPLEIGGYRVYPYEKAIAQALVLPVPNVVIEEYTKEEIMEIPSKRGIGALGSSGK